MKKFDNLENFIKRNLADYYQAPSEDHWDKIWNQAQIKQPKNIFWNGRNLLLSALLIGLTSTSIGLFYFWKKANDNETSKIEHITQNQNNLLNDKKADVKNNTEEINSNKQNQVSQAEISFNENQNKSPQATINNTNDNRAIDAHIANNSNLIKSKKQSLSPAKIHSSSNAQLTKSTSSLSNNHFGNYSDSKNEITPSKLASIKEINHPVQENSIQNQSSNNISNTSQTMPLTSTIEIHNEDMHMPQNVIKAENQINANTPSNNDLLSSIPSLKQFVIYQKKTQSQLIVPQLQMPQIKAHKNPSAMQGAIVAGAMLSTSKFQFKNEENRPVVRRNFSHEKTIFGINTALGYQLHIPLMQNWNIMTGLELSNTNYVIDHVINFRYRDRHNAPNPNSNGADFNYDFNAASGTINLDVRSENTTNEKIADQDKVQLKIVTNSNTQYLALPLMIGRNYDISKVNIGASLGIKPYYELGSSVRITDVIFNHHALHALKDATNIKRINASNKFGCNAMIQLHVGIPLSNRIRLGVSPSFEYSIRDNKTNQFAIYNSYKLGALTSLIWKF